MPKPPQLLLAEADARIFGDLAARTLPRGGGSGHAAPTSPLTSTRAGACTRSPATCWAFSPAFPGARAWRRVLSEGAHRPGAGLELLDDALSAVSAQAA